MIEISEAFLVTLYIRTTSWFLYKEIIFMKKVICAGHVCIDISPAIPNFNEKHIEKILTPGKLLNVGPADCSVGGSVSNTGLGMKILGADVSLMGKIGDDPFGDMIAEVFRKYGVEDGLIRQQGETTSYSVVLAIPGIDRIFLHHTGANDTFCTDDIPWDKVKDAALFHFGYPPLMRSMYARDGGELVHIMKEAQKSGVATSLDLAAVDPDSDAGKADWNVILKRVLPYVDIFVPSIEELCYMLDRERFLEWKERAQGTDVCDVLDLDNDIRPLADICMSYGVKILMIKCGTPGMYLRTAPKEQLDNISDRMELDTIAWSKQDMFEKSYVPDKIISGTGCGDTSIAAFLTSMMDGYSPDMSMHLAAATGACCVAAYDAQSGLKKFPELEKRIKAGWKKLGN